MQRAEKISGTFLKLIQGLFDGGRPPEQNYRTCDGLLSIYRKQLPRSSTRPARWPLIINVIPTGIY